MGGKSFIVVMSGPQRPTGLGGKDVSDEDSKEVLLSVVFWVRFFRSRWSGWAFALGRFLRHKTKGVNQFMEQRLRWSAARLEFLGFGVHETCWVRGESDRYVHTISPDHLGPANGSIVTGIVPKRHNYHVPSRSPNSVQNDLTGSPFQDLVESLCYLKPGGPGVFPTQRYEVAPCENGFVRSITQTEA
jgi:hypothetical protein